MEHVDLHFLGRELDKRVGKSFDRAVDVAFDDDIELLEVADRAATSDIFECKHLGGAETLLAGKLLSLEGYVACLLLRLEHIECVAGCRSSVKAEYKRRHCGSCLFDALVTLVEHGLDLAEVVACDNYVAHAESAVLHEYVCHIAAALVKRRFDNRTHSATVGVGLEVEHFGFEKHLFHKFFHADTFFG